MLMKLTRVRNFEDILIFLISGVIELVIHDKVNDGGKELNNAIYEKDWYLKWITVQFLYKFNVNNEIKRTTNQCLQ